MKKYSIFCTSCSRQYMDQWWLCPFCGGSLDVKYSRLSAKPQFPLKGNSQTGIGEGNTPLFYLPKLSEQENLFLCGDYLLRREGQKIVGWELAAENFGSFVVPVGNGTVGIAIAKGLSEPVKGKKTPKFIGVQAKNVNPIEKSWRTG